MHKNRSGRYHYILSKMPQYTEAQAEIRRTNQSLENRIANPTSRYDAKKAAFENEKYF